MESSAERVTIENYVSKFPSDFPAPASVSKFSDEEGIYRSLTETIPVQVWTATPDGQLDYVSEQTARSLGRPAVTILTEGWQAVVHPEDLPSAIASWTKALSEGDPYETEFRLRLASGQYRWFLARAVPQRNTEGQVVRWFGTNTDIEGERQRHGRIQQLLSELEQQASQLKERNQLLALEVAIGALVVNDQPLHDRLVDALELIASYLHVTHCSLWVFDKSGVSLQLTASAGADRSRVGIPATIFAEQGELGQFFGEQRQVVINDEHRDTTEKRHIPGDDDWLRREKIAAFVVTPLKVDGNSLGLLGTWSTASLSKAAVSILGAVVNSLAQTIERHRAAERIRLSEAWLSTTLSSIGDGVIATDATGLVTYANPVAQELTGWVAHECVGRHLDESFHIVNETTRARVESPVAKVLREGVVVGMANHTILLRRDGSELSIEDSAAPIVTDDGTLNGIVLVFRDASAARESERERVTLLKTSQKAQEDAKEARDHLYALFMQAPASICVLRGKDHVFELTNPSYKRLVGGRDVVGLSVREALPELAGQGFFELLDRVFATGERFEGKELPVALTGPVGETGEEFLDFVYEPMLTHQGEVDGVLVLATNVTERVKARHVLEETLVRTDRLNQELADAESILRRLVDNLPELAWSARPDGYIDFYNRRWFDYTGTTPEDMLGWGWKSVHDPSTLETVIERWQHSIETGERFEMEFPLRAADGRFRWFLTRVEPLRDSSDKIVRWFGTNTDIHMQREEGQKAMEANMAKDEFLATASHELRNPLSAILGWARLLRAGDVDPSMYARGLETIERNANAQVQLIDDILDGSRIITGNLRLDVQPLDLTMVVQTALETVRPAAEAKQILIETCLDTSAARIVGDAERLQQIVWNLVTNAVKFTPRGGRIELKLERSDSNIELIVSDSGEGIDPEFLPHVFERFRQADASSTRRHGGLGLGLALVRFLVEAHGGRVQAESEGLGHGARFRVSLPVGAIFATKENLSAAALESEGVGLAILKGIEILVVDDEVDGRDLVATVLRGKGAKVITAGSAEEALELFRQYSVTVIVSDVGMPGMDGYELMRRIRGFSGEAGTKVQAIALTAYVRDQDRRRALEAGFQTHLTKPVEPAALVRALVDLVGRGSCA